MTFWLEKEWQQCAAHRISAALNKANEELLPRKLGNRDWTKQMLSTLAPVAVESCAEHAPFAACSFGGGEHVGYRKGWLYDFCCWVADSEQRLLGLPIVVESEWQPWNQVLDDFEKLLQVRAGLRVLIFQHDKTMPTNWCEELLLRTDVFEESDSADAWLFALWRDGRFHYESKLSY